MPIKTDSGTSTIKKADMARQRRGSGYLAIKKFKVFFLNQRKIYFLTTVKNQ